MKIVTAGGGFLDIDGLGAGVAYAELLTLQGIPAKFVSTGGMNGSVTPTIRSWNLPVNAADVVHDGDTFIVVDNSAPDWLEPCVVVGRIDEIIDHHLGHEAYWRERGVTTDIEFVGACSTQIYERWVRANKIDEMSKMSAGLLASGILDNTLDFKASVTTDRDKIAYAELLKKSGLRDRWDEHYFEECQEDLEGNLENALIYDTKMSIQYPGCEKPVNISQIAAWNGRRFLERKDELLRLTERFGPDRSVHIISISEGKNYFVTPSEKLRTYYGQILGVPYQGDTAASDRLWLRKEIMKQSLEYQGVL